MATLVMISKKKPSRGLTRTEKIVRGVLVGAYVLITVGMFVHPILPRIFWTMGLPLLPLGIVIAGFYPWRKVCPLAFWGEQGRRFKGDRKQRRVPKWMERNYPLITLGTLFLGLSGRLLATNGDGIFLGSLLIGLGVAAAATNFFTTGKTWCNFVCPVSIVERIYTEPNSLRREDNSQCTKCTACKKNCPDIDQENAYWKDVEEGPRRVAYFSFPGLVSGFYVYFWLRAGNWEAYYGGGWTARGADIDLLTGPGLFFAPQIPAFVAAPLSLLVFCALSFGLFALAERICLAIWKDPELTRHRMLTVAGFAAFSLFYVWAGQPTLRRLPLGTQLAAFVAPLVATLFLIKRLRRSRSNFMEEKSAKKLLKKWSFDEPPPDDTAGVFAYFKAREQAHEEQVAVYRDTVLECLADGTLTASELHILEQLRSQLNITESEHKKILSVLSEEQREAYEGKTLVSVEEELQMAGYREALSQALLERGTPQALERIRREFAIAPETHANVMAELRGESSPLVARAKESLERIDELRERLAALAPLQHLGTFDFALLVITKAQSRMIGRVIDTLALLGEGQRVHAAAAELDHKQRDRRESVVDKLRKVTNAEFVDRLAPAIIDPVPAADTTADDDAINAAIEWMLASTSPYLRAGAIMAVGHLRREQFSDAVRVALADDDPLVRETAIYAALRAPGFIDEHALAPMLGDDVPEIRRAAREAIEALGDMEDDGQPPTANPIRVVEGRTLPPMPDAAFSSMATVDRMLFLRCVPLFAQLDPEDLHEICAYARERTIRPPRAICKQGELSDELYVIIDGEAVVSVQTPTGDQQVARLSPGDVVGELAAIDLSPRSASVEPDAGPVRVLEITGDDFRRRLARRQDVAPRIMATLSRRLRETLAKVR